MTNFKHTAKGRAALAQTEADNEGMFQYARKDNQCIKSLIDELDMSDELDYFHRLAADSENPFGIEDKEKRAIFNEYYDSIINDSTLTEAIGYLIKSNEQYARRFWRKLIRIHGDLY